MKRILLLVPCAAGIFLLSACSNANSAPAPQPNDAGSPQISDAGTSGTNPAPGGQRQAFNQQDLQRYVDEANAAADKTVITKDQFTTEMTALRQKQLAQFQQQGGQQFSQGNRPRFGSGAFRQGQGSSGRMNMQDRLATATTFWKYTDPSGSEVLLALGADGKAIMKWPMAFGRGGSRGAGGGQPPAGNPPEAQ